MWSCPNQTPWWGQPVRSLWICLLHMILQAWAWDSHGEWNWLWKIAIEINKILQLNSTYVYSLTVPRCFTEIWRSCVSQLAPLPQALPSPGKVCKLWSNFAGPLKAGCLCNGCCCPKANGHTTYVSMAQRMEHNVGPQKKLARIVCLVWGGRHCGSFLWSMFLSHGTIK